MGRLCEGAGRTGVAVALAALLTVAPAAPITNERPGPDGRTARAVRVLVPNGEGELLATDTASPKAAEKAAREAVARMPLWFVENQGQVDPRVAYYSQGRDTSVYFTASGVTYALAEQAPAARRHRRGPGIEHASRVVEPRRGWTLKLEYLGARAGVWPVGEARSAGVVSYFLGSERESWKPGLATFGRVTYRDLWPGIDLEYTGEKAGRLKYTYVVHPGADPTRIQVRYAGASGVRRTPDGRLEVRTPVTDLVEDRPYVYQEVDGKRVEVESAYDVLRGEAEAGGDRVGFRIGRYDASLPLYVDPAVLRYCGFFGGSGWDQIDAVAVDAAGNAYVLGETSSAEGTRPGGFPDTAGAWDTAGDTSTYDTFVAKIRANPNDATTENNLFYCTFLGASGAADNAGGIAIDAAGNAYVWGDTWASSFPTTVGPDLTWNLGSSDGFVTKLNPTGTALVYSGFVGGGGQDQAGQADDPAGIAVDGSGAAYVTGYTNSTNIATVVGPDTSWNGGGSDAFVAKVKADGSGFDYLGYIGGTQTDRAYAIAVDSAGNAYVGGATFSPLADGFPATVGPDLAHTGNWDQDGFICRLKATQTVQADPRNNYDYCGYIGGVEYDQVNAIAVVASGPSQGVVFLGGDTFADAATFPEKLGPSLVNPDPGANATGFVAKMNANPNNATPENNYVYCGYIGGTGEDRVRGIAIDASNDVYVTGYTASTEATFPAVLGPDLTYNLGAYDAFVAKLKTVQTVQAVPANNYVYSGYIGGTGDDRAFRIAVAGTDAYVVGVTASTEATFPETVGPDLTHNGGTWDGFVARLSGGPTVLYRSVGNNGGAALASGGGTNTLTIAGSTATFASAIAPNIGVGDVIQYNSNGALAFIHSRTSSQVFTVKDKAGNAPTTVAGDTGWFVYRAYRSLANWESQTENASIVPGLQNFDTSTDIVAANTIMIVACYADANDTTPVQISGWTTDPSHYISIFTPYLSGHVGATQRHAGTWASGGYALVAAMNFTGVLDIRADHVRVTGLRIDNTQAENAGGGNQVLGILSRSTDNAPFEVQVSHNIVRTTGSVALNAHDWRDSGLYQYSSGGVLKAWNNIIYGFGSGIASEYMTFGGTYALYNNTVPDYSDMGIYFQGAGAGNYRWANNLVQGLGGGGNYRTADLQAPGLDFSATNLSQDNTSPNGAAFQLKTVTFVGAPDYHLSPGDFNAKDQGTNLSSDPVLAVLDDIDRQLRQAPWDIGADDVNGTTAVKLMSFSAASGDRSVTLEWRTASELDNLGFHVYRGLSEGGPWTRLTTSLIPGLGSSAVGKAYSFRDAGLVNGTRYYYRLEDVDASSKVTSHGPVFAVPLAGAAAGVPGSEPEASGGNKKGASPPSCPDWVVAAYGSMAGASASSATFSCTRHGDPEAGSLGVVSRDSRQATLELKTGGFYALHTPSGAGGAPSQVRVFVPGFDFPQDPQAPALPFRRALVDAVAGRRAQLGGVRALDQVSFKGLVPAALGKAELEVSRDGTVRAGRRAVGESAPRHVSLDLARLLPSVFQGETKSAVVEITPLRFDARRKQIVLAKRVLVKLLFTARETEESGRGSFGRRQKPEKPVAGELLARLHTTQRGLHAVSFEQLFPGRQRGFASSDLRLERQGQAVAFHVERASQVFGPGSVLYFHADTTASSTDFSSETTWELLRAQGGVRMPLVPAAPAGDAVRTASMGQASFEVNRFYQPGLLEAEDLWQWEILYSGTTRAQSFTLAGVDASSPQAAELVVYLQGASESGNPVDHHVAVSVNGVPVGDAQFAGKRPYRMSLSLSASLLRGGANELQLTNVGDMGVTSYVFLDRFTIAHPQLSSLAGGRLAGEWPESGSVSLQAPGAVSGPVRIVDLTGTSETGNGTGTNGVGGTGNGTGGAGTTGTTGPAWLTGLETTAGGVRFRVDAGHRYWVGSDSALFSPRVSRPLPSGLKSTANQADYLLVAPQAFLAAAEPLLQRRRDQGLEARAVSLEQVADEFGHGQPSAEAIRSFIGHAFHAWARPSPRYVLLLGDSTYDPRNFTGTARPSPLPALWTKTSYLWTASDPLLAAVNGEDELPDLAIGRLPAATVDEARLLVEKLLAWEGSGQGLAGDAALVADNPDLGGEFEADVQDIAASVLAGRNPRLLLLRELGVGTRPAIRDALDSGLSLLSYVGHGGAAVWASENVWNSWDAASLQAQSRQPLLLTMNCLNGYFVAPAFDSLAESLLKAGGRGAIAAISPSGLSLDGPAHQYHRALVAELTSGRHERLGDALAAAQKAYAGTGLMPELLSVYHLFGDPATSLR